jgi:hypothetical protein
VLFERLTFPLTVESSAEAAEPVSKASGKRSARRESLGVAHCRSVCFARREAGFPIGQFHTDGAI